MSRIVAWFSCGAASAVAAKLAVAKYGERCEVVNCWTQPTEHPDNARFFGAVEKWIGQPITVIRSEKYATVDDVFEQRRYLAGPKGALCTVEMKKIPRFRFQRADDLHVFGFTADERARIVRFEMQNQDLDLEWILSDRKITKAACLAMLRAAGIEPPIMYALGFRNNNCLGCVKATSPAYWSLVRKHFPDVFARRVRQGRDLGVRLARHRGQRVFLDELPEGHIVGRQEHISCGPECGAAE